MKFGEQIKKLRKDRNITQQEMADKLNISRQAISNWENDKNLPDLEMLITMSQVFQITLDELILGGTQMNNMTEKLIQDSSINTRIKMNLRGIQIGSTLLALGFISLIIGIFGPISMENLFSMAFVTMMFCGIITFLVIGIKNITSLFGKRQNTKNAKIIAIGGILIVVGISIYIASLTTNIIPGLPGFGAIALGIVFVIIGSVTSRESANE